MFICISAVQHYLQSLVLYAKNFVHLIKNGSVIITDLNITGKYAKKNYIVETANKYY